MSQRNALTQNGRRFLREATAAHGDTPITLTPGSRRLLGRINRATGDFYQEPVVVLGLTSRRMVAKRINGSVCLFEPGVRAEWCSAHDWARALWRHRTAAGGQV